MFLPHCLHRRTSVASWNWLATPSCTGIATGGGVSPETPLSGAVFGGVSFFVAGRRFGTAMLRVLRKLARFVGDVSRMRAREALLTPFDRYSMMRSFLSSSFDAERLPFGLPRTTPSFLFCARAPLMRREETYFSRRASVAKRPVTAFDELSPMPLRSRACFAAMNRTPLSRR